MSSPQQPEDTSSSSSTGSSIPPPQMAQRALPVPPLPSPRLPTDPFSDSTSTTSAPSSRGNSSTNLKARVSIANPPTAFTSTSARPPSSSASSTTGSSSYSAPSSRPGSSSSSPALKSILLPSSSGHLSPNPGNKPNSVASSGSIGFIPGQASKPSSVASSGSIGFVPGQVGGGDTPPMPVIGYTVRASARISRLESLGALHRKALPRMKSHMLPISLLTNSKPSTEKGPDGLSEADKLEAPKPWLSKSNPRATFSYYLVYFLVFLGAAGGAIQAYFDYRNVPLDKAPLCLVLDEDFSDPSKVFADPTDEGKSKGTFFREVNLDGFGNGQFDMTTASSNNSFVLNNQLYIVPTLTSSSLPDPNLVFDGGVYNATQCTFNVTRPNGGYILSDPSNPNSQKWFDSSSYLRACSAISNKTTGSIINPVQSARLTTRYSASIKFGRVEIKAKLPRGDWMWPAIWLLPRDNVYGEWPLSGEIDMVESRGNGLRYTNRGKNYVQGSLNWGPAVGLNGVDKSYSWWWDKRKGFDEDFHTYVLEWTPEFIRMSVDTRLHTLLDLRFNQPFFKRGDFPQVIFNGSSLEALQNPWINGTNATPFDQEFYLILNVAVGSTNGWFPEGQGDKPWLDRSPSPPRDFANALKQWYPTWPTNAYDRGMVVDYVKMWKRC